MMRCDFTRPLIADIFSLITLCFEENGKSDIGIYFLYLISFSISIDIKMDFQSSKGGPRHDLEVELWIFFL